MIFKADFQRPSTCGDCFRDAPSPRRYSNDYDVLMFPRSLFLVIAAVICSCVIAPVQQARVFGESDKIAIRNSYHHCLLASIRKDYAALLESFQAPFVVLA